MCNYRPGEYKKHKLTEMCVLTHSFGPMEADYMFHCHNSVHEDNAMMGAFGTSRGTRR
jgi:FtsP/CotA-like multicopper oxidase with cupredoxin domain